MLSLVRGEALSVEGADLEQLVKKHEEYRVQIDRQLGKSQAVKDEGRRLMEGGNFMSQEVTEPRGRRQVTQVSAGSMWASHPSSASQVEERVCELEELEVRVEKVWEDTRLLYEEELEILVLQRELEQAERWLSSYENTLSAQDYGVGPSHH